MENETKVTPWEVTSTTGIDYLRLIQEFGCQPIDADLIYRFEKVTGKKAHPWLRRGIFFSHKDFNLILDNFEKGEEIYLYTGRGPSSESLHLGHMIPLMFTQYLQDAFDAIVIIQMSDDEKFYFKENLTLEEANRLSRVNAKDIIACGFKPNKTWIFSNLETVGGSYYRNIVKIMRHTPGNMIHGIYGLDLNNSVGQISWPCYQAAPAFSSSFENVFKGKECMCLVPMAIDQYPYFRMSRDIARRLGYKRPATIQSRFLPSLEQAHDKASSTGSREVIFMNDSEKILSKKIQQKAFSGGGMTREEHIKNGANLFVDVPYHYLLYFLDNDEELERIAREYRAGKMMSGEIKKQTIEIIWKVLKKHQDARSLVTEEVVDFFMNSQREFDHSRAVKTTPFNNDINNEKTSDKSIPIGFSYDPYFQITK